MLEPYRGGRGVAADFGGLGTGAASGVTLGYWKVWERSMSISIYVQGCPELRPGRIKQCCSPRILQSLPPRPNQSLLVAFSRQLIIADDVPVAPSA